MHTDISQSYIFKHKMIQRVEKFRNPTILKRFLDQPETFVQLCGDRYISQVDYGGFLNVAVQFLFKHPEAKKQFDLEFGAEVSIVEIGAKIHALSEYVKNHTSLGISYHIIGAHSKSFDQFFKGDDYVKCSLKDFKHCEKLLAHVANYVKGTFTQDVEKSAVSIDFKRSPYPGIRPHELRKITPHMEMQKKSLVKIGEKLYEHRQKAELLLETRKHLMSAERKASVLKVKETIEELIDVVQEKTLECFEYPDLCSALDEEAITYNERELDPKPIEDAIDSYFVGKKDIIINVPPTLPIKVKGQVEEYESWDHHSFVSLEIFQETNSKENPLYEFYQTLNLTKNEASVEFHIPPQKHMATYKLMTFIPELGFGNNNTIHLPFKDIKESKDRKKVVYPFYYVKERWSLMMGTYYSILSGSIDVSIE
jgi:hypothetical protein